MGFQLTIAEGKEAGREFVFEQDSVTIGRSSDCDVVLYDPGVSRRHARIFTLADQLHVEDMGSSNGTKVNGQLVKKHKLQDGDSITLGPVTFSFVGTVLPEDVTGEHGVADVHTRIVSVDQVKRQKGKGEALAPQGAGKEQLQQLGRSQTQTMQAVSRPRNSNPRLTRSAPDADVAVVPPRPARGGAVVPSDGGGKPVLSAAERARIRRESPGMLGSLKLFWLEASGRARAAVYAAGALVAAGLVAGLYWVVLVGPGRDDNRPPEPSILARTTIEQSFGLGEGVTYERPDMKVFKFEYLAPTRALVILYFQAQDVSQGEVSIIANGREVGLVPPDTLGSADRLLDVVIPPDVLKRGEPNEIIFDNVRNPPGRETWRIWNLRIDPVPLPEVPLDQLVREAKASFDRASLTEQRIDVGAENRYEAWKGFRNAWLLLEGHPDPRPELYDISRLRMRQAQQELDRTCARLMLEVERFYNHKEYESARATLDHVKKYFPNANDHLCPRKAEMKRYNYGL
jgi:pSer/pThr/pTyr-binding forkhead associated (FHA) protein